MKNKVTKLVILLSLAALALFTQQQDAMVILPNGNVGINTETPEHRLEVDGDMAVTEDLTVGGNITATNFIVAPVGSIIAFHPNITSPPLEIPDGWMACDGTVVSDEDSPLNGLTLPDLNREVYAGGRGFYLRGGSESGGWNESTYWTDNGTRYGNIGSGVYYGASFARFNDLDDETESQISYSQSRLGDSRRFQVAAMTVVWIMRVK